eukprot:jgi/Botrbrau1/3257/Bobra.174_1s0029.1
MGSRGGRGEARLEVLRAARLAGNPKEEDALLGEARALSAAKAAAAGTQEAAPQGTGRGRGRGRRGRGRSGRGGSRGSAPAPAELESPPPNVSPPLGGQKDGEDVGVPQSEVLQGVKFRALENRDESTLFDVQPAFVVMYDPDIAFIRQLEVYKAERPGWPLRVYHLRYEESLESDKFNAGLARERRVFEELIRSKAHMVLPDLKQELEALSRAGKGPLVHPDVLEAGPASSQNALTRRAGGRLSNRPLPRRVVVDMREFMSALPAVLHQQGLLVTPVTLEVGDYVLSPEICVERKSISDLRSSLASGRLYHQAEAMSRHYRLPVLLIEFERDKAFLLHSPHDIGPDILATSLISKLVLLTLHFPRLRIIWSRSLHATADIFGSLKSNQEEPDPLLASAVGAPAEGDDVAAGGTAAETVVNTAAVDLLRRLPGVTEANFRAVMNAAGSLAGLADLPLEALTACMGPHNGKKLRDWLDAVCPRMA